MGFCFFLGHRAAPPQCYPLLCESVERHIRQYGITEFMIGRPGQFTAMAWRAVRRAKERFPEVTLTQLTRSSDSGLPLSDSVDGAFCPQTGRENISWFEANMGAIVHCNSLVAYLWQPGSRDLSHMKLARAMQRNGWIRVDNLFDALGDGQVGYL